MCNPTEIYIYIYIYPTLLLECTQLPPLKKLHFEKIAPSENTLIHSETQLPNTNFIFSCSHCSCIASFINCILYVYKCNAQEIIRKPWKGAKNCWKKHLFIKTLEKYNLELIHLRKMAFILEKGKCSIQYSDVRLG